MIRYKLEPEMKYGFEVWASNNSSVVIFQEDPTGYTQDATIALDIGEAEDLLRVLPEIINSAKEFKNGETSEE